MNLYLPPVFEQAAMAGLELWAPLMLPDLELLRPAEAASSVDANSPVLILVGTRDQRAPLTDAEAILARVPDGRIVLFPDLGHVSLHKHDRERWAAQVLPFLQELEGPVD